MGRHLFSQRILEKWGLRLQSAMTGHFWCIDKWIHSKDWRAAEKQRLTTYAPGKTRQNNLGGEEAKESKAI